MQARRGVMRCRCISMYRASSSIPGLSHAHARLPASLQRPWSLGCKARSTPRSSHLQRHNTCAMRVVAQPGEAQPCSGCHVRPKHVRGHAQLQALLLPGQHRGRQLVDEQLWCRVCVAPVPPAQQCCYQLLSSGWDCLCRWGRLERCRRSTLSVMAHHGVTCSGQPSTEGIMQELMTVQCA